MSEQPPAPKFQRFERVSVVDEPFHYPKLRGRSGTILWRDVDWVSKTPPGRSGPGGWLYLVYFSPETAYRTLWESDLQSEELFDTELEHLATRPEFTFDIILEEDMSWVEGCYRLPGRFWQVMIFGKQDVSELRHRPNRPPSEWPSGITGAIFDVPRGAKLDREYVRRALVSAFGFEEWTEVRGPDSMVLR